MDPLSSTIIGTIAKELISAAFKAVSRTLRSSNFKLSISEKNLEFSLLEHMTKIFAWSQDLEGLNLDDSKKTGYVYIDLEYYLTPRETHYSAQRTELKLVDTIFTKTNKHIAILGEAGMGKTSSMKKIVYKWMTDEHYLKLYSTPIVILFREIKLPSSIESGEYYLTKYIQYELGLFITFKNAGPKEEQTIPDALLKKCVWQYLDLHNFLIIMDGFDEIPGWLQRSIYKEIDEMSKHLQNSRIVLTSRTSGFKFHPAHIHLFEISPFSDEQVFNFSRNWLGDEEGERFFREVIHSVFKEIVGRPLILSYLAMLYQINKKIPEEPASLYEQVVYILLHKWDDGRAINRQSLFESFNYLKKQDFLSHLAFHLLKANKVAFSNTDLRSAYHSIQTYFPDLPLSKADDITNEIREHSSLIIVGGFDSFQFAHKSIQEYFAGIFISKFHPLNKIRDYLRSMPYECAMATTLSSDPSGFFTEMILLIDKTNLAPYFSKIIELKPIFPVSVELGYHVLRLWDVFFAPNFDLYFDIMGLKGVKESINKLNRFYHPDHAELQSKKQIANPRSVVKIKRRSIHDAGIFPEFTLKVPLYVIREWHYVDLDFK